MAIPTAESAPQIPVGAVEALSNETGQLREVAQHWARPAAGLLLAAATAAGVAAAVKGYTPNPEVSSAGSEALIDANSALRAAGPYVLYGTLGAGAAIGVSYLRRPRTRAMFEYTRGDTRRGNAVLRTAGAVLPAFVLSATAVGSGISTAASEGANAPIKFMKEATGADDQPSAILLQHNNTTPLNGSTVLKSDIAKVMTYADGHWQDKARPAKVIPFDLRLGSLENPNKKTNPSSSPIVALPNQVIQKALGVSLAKTKEDMPVIVGDQLAVDGDPVIVEGKDAVVASTVDKKVGLDRVLTIGSLEGMQGTVFRGNTNYGAVVTGVTPEELNSALDAMGLPDAAVSFEEFQEMYNEFWHRSVDPPEMQLIAYLAFSGMIATAYMRTVEVMARRREYAIYQALGNERKTFNRAENLRAVMGSVKALGGAALIGVPLLTYVNNSSQYGVGQEVDAKSVGAGLAVVLATNLGSAFAARSMTRRIDTAEEIRA